VAPRDFSQLIVVPTPLSGQDATAFVANVFRGLKLDGVFSDQEEYRGRAVANVCHEIFEMLAQSKAEGKDAPTADELCTAAINCLEDYPRITVPVEAAEDISGLDFFLVVFACYGDLCFSSLFCLRYRPCLYRLAELYPRRSG
jgi:hypothetical protein